MAIFLVSNSFGCAGINAASAFALGFSAQHYDQGEKSPVGERQLVGIKEVVHHSVDKVGDEREGGRQTESPHALVMAPLIGAEAVIEHQHDQRQHREKPHETGLCRRTDILAVRILVPSP